MAEFFRKLLLVPLVSALAFAAFADDEGLAMLWMVTDSITIQDHETTYNGVADYNANHDGPDISAARVAVSDGGETVYLNLYYEFDGEFLPVEGATLASLEAGTSYRAGPIWASLAGGDYSTASFTIELCGMDEGVWNVLAVSESSTYAELERHISIASIDLPGYTPWAPTTYAVPEPTSGLLLLLGSALLALRRKRRVQPVTGGGGVLASARRESES